MGRSVSTPSNTAHVEYSVLVSDRYYCSHCGDTFNEYGKQDEEDCCPHCAAPAIDCHEQDSQDDWDFYTNDLIEQMQRAFPSLDTCDAWLGNEDHAVLDNKFCHVGVSEYCGVAAVWMAAKEPDYYEGEGWVNVRDRWIDQVAAKFTRTARSCFGRPIIKVGAFSNGECVYQSV